MKKDKRFEIIKEDNGDTYVKSSGNSPLPVYIPLDVHTNPDTGTKLVRSPGDHTVPMHIPVDPSQLLNE